MKLPSGFVPIDSKQELEYLLNKNPTRNHDIPVPGYYKILRLEEIDHINPLYRTMAFANWKKSNDEEYGSDEFCFRMSPLFNNASVGPKNLSLLGKCILIHQITVEELEFSGIPYKSYKVVWEEV